MYLQCINKNWYLYQKQKDKKGKIFKRTIAKFGRIKPDFKLPFVYRGMCDDLIKSIKDKSINLILTDPPFGITDNKWDVPPDWKQVAKEYSRILADNGQIAIFGTIPNILNIYYGFQELFDFRYDCVWYKGVKTAFGVCNNRPLRTHEHIFIFKKKECDVTNTVFNPKKIGVKGEPYTWVQGSGSSNYGKSIGGGFITESDGYRMPESVINVGGIGYGNKEHMNFPTQKPERLIGYFVRGLSNINDIILDPYLGSGTTAKVSMENCRFCIGSEIDPTSYPIMQKRFKTTMKQLDVKWRVDDGFLQFPLRNMMEGCI